VRGAQDKGRAWSGPPSAPGRTRTHDPLLRSKHGRCGVLTWENAGPIATKAAQLSALDADGCRRPTASQPAPRAPTPERDRCAPGRHARTLDPRHPGDGAWSLRRADGAESSSCSRSMHPVTTQSGRRGSNTDGRPTRTPLCSQFEGRRCPSDPARPHVSTRAAATLPIPPRVKATEPGPRHAVILEPDGFVADGATLLDTPAHRRRGRQQAGQSTVSGCRRRTAMQSRSLATGRGRGCPARVGGRGGGLIVGAATRHRVRKLGRCR
jgi:hypothetical protein